MLPAGAGGSPCTTTHQRWETASRKITRPPRYRSIEMFAWVTAWACRSTDRVSSAPSAGARAAASCASSSARAAPQCPATPARRPGQQRRRGQGRREPDAASRRGRSSTAAARRRVRPGAGRHRGHAHREPGQLPLQPAHLPGALLAARRDDRGRCAPHPGSRLRATNAARFSTYQSCGFMGPSP